MSLVLILCFCFTLMWSFSNSQLIKYGCVILFNVTMWGCYVNSLKALSSLQATVTNFATNFLSSGLAGFLLFREPLPIQVICEICATLFMNYSMILRSLFLVSPLLLFYGNPGVVALLHLGTNHEFSSYIS